MSGSQDMRARVTRGLGWVGASQVAMQLTRTIGAVIVARLLLPSDYGLAMLALVFASLVLVFSDMALGAALVQRKHLSEADRSTAFWITIGSGVLFTGLGVLCSGPVADLYGTPAAQPLLAGLSASFLLTALGSTQQSLLLREMNFKRSESLAMFGALLGTCAAVALAFMGVGAWAIIGQQLVTSGATSLLLWHGTSWRPKLTFSKASAKDLAGFSGYLVGSRLLFYVHQNADRFLIGRFIGTAALGAYAVAYNLMLQPATRIATPVQRILAPAFARMQDEPERIAAAWARATRLVGTVTIPALVGLVVVAPDFVPVVLGDKWSQAIPVIQVVAWVGILQALQAINVDILVARDRTATVFRYTLGFCAAHLVAFTVGLHWGVVGVAVAYAISSTFVEPFLTVLTARCIGVSPWVFVRSVTGIAQAAAGMALVMLATRELLLEAGAPALVRLVAVVAIGSVTFIPLLLWREPEVLRDVRSLLGDRMPRIGRRRAVVAPAVVES